MYFARQGKQNRCSGLLAHARRPQRRNKRGQTAAEIVRMHAGHRRGCLHES